MAKHGLGRGVDTLFAGKKDGREKKEEAIMVGDTKTDLDAAKNASMLSIGCLYGFRDKKELEEHGAKYLVKDGEELWQVLEENFLEK